MLTCYFATPTAVGTDHLYMVTGRVLKPEAVLRCVDAKTGKSLWFKDKVGKYHASLIRTGDDKLLMLEENGALVLVQPDPKEYRARLAEQEDAQLDAWVAELMRDVAKRRGVFKVLADFAQVTGLGDAEIERVFASGGGAPANAGRVLSKWAMCFWLYGNDTTPFFYYYL